jgi:hypothetical protein
MGWYRERMRDGVCSTANCYASLWPDLHAGSDIHYHRRQLKTRPPTSRFDVLSIHTLGKDKTYSLYMILQNICIEMLLHSVVIAIDLQVPYSSSQWLTTSKITILIKVTGIVIDMGFSSEAL